MKINLEVQPSKEDDEALELKYNSTTPAERQIMKMVASGLSESKMANLLNLSPKTVEAHRANLMGKLKIHNIADITRVWMKFGDKTDPLKEEDTLP